MVASSFDVLIAPWGALFSCVTSSEVQSCIGEAAAPVVVASGLVALSLGLLAYVLSFITGNDSWVDRSWSVVPPGFAWFYVWYQNDAIIVRHPETGVVRPTSLGIFAVVTSIWGLRLSYNFYRRGGYTKGGEDYRWEHVRAWPIWKNRLLWQIFSFGFISLFQEWLLWAITIPLIALTPNTIATAPSLIVAFSMMAFIAVETTADQQQWNFQNEKRNLKPRRAGLENDYAAGFLTHGLFSRSRHPNVWAEQQIWMALYCIAAAKWGALNWSGLGTLSLVLLTVRSCALTEELSSSKYPLYRKYRNVVPILIPSRSGLRDLIDTKLFGKSK